MRNIVEFINRNMMLFLPHILIFFIFISIGIALLLIKKKNEKLDLYQYFSGYRGKSYVKRTLFDTISESIFTISIYFTVGCFWSISAAFIYSNYATDSQFTNTISSMVNGLPSIMLQFCVMMITVAAMLVMFKKDYYLVFTLAEVLEQYKFKKKVLLVINMMALSQILEILVKCVSVSSVKFVTEISILPCYIISLLISLHLVYRVMNLLYSNENIELKLLDNLYYKVRRRNLIDGIHSECNGRGVIINTEYLYDVYNQAYKSLSKSKMLMLKYYSVHKEIIDDAFKIVLKSIIKKISAYLLTFSGLYFLMRGWSNDIIISLGFSWGLWIVLIIVMIIIAHSSKIKIIKQIINRMFLSDNVYVYNNEDNKQIIVSTSGIGVGQKNSKYFISILNLAVYYEMLLISNNENGDIFITCISKLFETDKNYNIEENELFYAILPLCGFISYMREADKESVIQRMKDIAYISVIKNREVKNLIKAIILNINCFFEEEDDEVLKEFKRFVKLIQ